MTYRLFDSLLTLLLLQSAIYGMSQSIPDRSIVNEIAWGFLDCMYNVNHEPAHENGVVKH